MFLMRACCIAKNLSKVVTRLRKLAASCEYGALTDELIRDRLVIGLKNQGDKVRLLREQDRRRKEIHYNLGMSIRDWSYM